MTLDLDIVERQITLLKAQIELGGFARCLQISADYTRYFVIVEDPDGIFFGELCQNVFSEMRTLAAGYKIPEENLSLIKMALKTKLDEILNAMKSGSTGDIYVAMRGLRNVMTKFQFDCWYSLGSAQSPRITFGPS